MMTDTNFLFDDDYLFRLKVPRGWIYGIVRPRFAMKVRYKVLHGWYYSLSIQVCWLELGFSTLPL